MKSIKTSLMFVGLQAGKAEEAIKFYTSLFPGSEIIDLQRYEAGEHEPEGGSELMPLDNYGFSQRFGWLNDKYGVSWQLNLSNQVGGSIST